MLWQRRRLWFTPHLPHGLARMTVPNTTTGLTCFVTPLHHASKAFLWDHRVGERPLMPAAAIVQACMGALAHLGATGSGGLSFAALSGSSIIAPMVLHTMVTQRKVDEAVLLAIEIDERSASVRVKSARSCTQTHSHVHFLSKAVTVTSQHNKLAMSCGNTPWPYPACTFHVLVQGALPTAIGRVVQEHIGSQGGEYPVHPAVLDNCTQLMAAFGSLGSTADSVLRVPAALALFAQLYPLSATHAVGTSRLIQGPSTQLTVTDCSLSSESCSPASMMFGMQYKPVRDKVATKPASQTLYSVCWQAGNFPSKASNTTQLPAGTGLAWLDHGSNERHILHIPLRRPLVTVLSQSLQYVQQVGAKPIQLVARSSQAGAAGAALLRVATQELGLLAKCMYYQISQETPQSLAVAASAPRADQSSLLMHGGSWFVPALLPTKHAALEANGHEEPGYLHTAATALVLGGSGQIGGLVAAWVAAGMITCIHMLARSGRCALSPMVTSSHSLAALWQCNGAYHVDLAAALTPVRARGAGIRMVFHAGGVLQDATLMKQTAAHMRAVLAPKTGAAAHLQQCCWGLPVFRWKLFSSLSGLLGTPGQANYAAANAGLDALADNMQESGDHSLGFTSGSILDPHQTICLGLGSDLDLVLCPWLWIEAPGHVDCVLSPLITDLYGFPAMQEWMQPVCYGDPGHWAWPQPKLTH